MTNTTVTMQTVFSPEKELTVSQIEPTPCRTRYTFMIVATVQQGGAPAPGAPVLPTPLVYYIWYVILIFGIGAQDTCISHFCLYCITVNVEILACRKFGDFVKTRQK